MRVFLIVGGIVVVLTVVVLAIKRAASGNTTAVGAPIIGTQSALLTASPSDMLSRPQTSLGFVNGKATFTAIPRPGSAFVPPSTGPSVQARTGRGAF